MRHGTPTGARLTALGLGRLSHDRTRGEIDTALPVGRAAARYGGGPSRLGTYELALGAEGAESVPLRSLGLIDVRNLDSRARGLSVG
jgi:hypothetical protein